MAGGLARAGLTYIDATAAEAVQFYVGNPRGWAMPEGDRAQDEAFVEGCAARGTVPYIHASLIVNVASPTEDTVTRSAEALAHALARGAALGARGVVFHAGAAVGAARVPEAYRRLREALLPLLDAAMAAGGPMLLVEPSAGGGVPMAARVEQLGPYLDTVDRHPWLGVCLDTCHAFAAGHDLTAPGGMTRTLDTLVEVCGADRLRLIHANDSKDACGSVRDRHETIGAGTIGRDAFAEMFAHPATRGIPVIVETPGGSGGAVGHAADIATLIAMRGDQG